MNEENYRVYSVNGPVVTVKGGRGLAMQDMVYVGKSRLIGEVVGIERDHATVQVYESTTGLAPVPSRPSRKRAAPLSPPAWTSPAWMKRPNGMCRCW